MAGTTKGARKMARKKLKKDPDYFRKLGQRNKGVPKSVTPYFARLKQENPALLKRIASRKVGEPDDEEPIIPDDVITGDNIIRDETVITPPVPEIPRQEQTGSTGFFLG